MSECKAKSGGICDCPFTAEIVERQLRIENKDPYHYDVVNIVAEMNQGGRWPYVVIMNHYVGEPY